jgi:hypothetical protein
MDTLRAITLHASSLRLQYIKILIMNNRHQVHNLIILDESGSMQSIKQLTIDGFNEIVQTVKAVEKKFPEQEHFISLVSFNGLDIKTHLWKEAVSKLVQLDASTYKPTADTPLFDAMGNSLTKLSAELKDAGALNVLVTVLTDGAENASKEYSGALIKQMVDELKNKNWTFTYIGTDHDVDAVAASISITNIMKFKKNAGGMKDLFAKESAARYSYSQKIRNNENTRSDFYQKED